MKYYEDIVYLFRRLLIAKYHIYSENKCNVIINLLILGGVFLNLDSCIDSFVQSGTFTVDTALIYFDIFLDRHWNEPFDTLVKLVEEI